jgi:branched-chain amino acid transport system substrate-binding protein
MFDFFDAMKKKGSQDRDAGAVPRRHHLRHRLRQCADQARHRSRLQDRRRHQVPRQLAVAAGEVQQLKAANADVLMPSSYTTDGILLVKTMAELGYKPNAIVAQDAGFSEKALYDAVGDKLEGVITRGSFSLDLAAKRPMVGKINDLFKAKSGKDFNDNTSRSSWA